MPSLKNNKYVPIEHGEVYKQLFSELVNKILFIPLRPIQRSEAEVISMAIDESIGYKFSSKQLQKLINEVAQNAVSITKPRPGTLNLLSQFVLDEYEINNKASYRNDKRNFWIIYLNKYSHLIISQENDADIIQPDEPYDLNQNNYNEVRSLIHINKLLPQKINKAESKKVYDMEMIYIFNSHEVKKLHKRAAIFGGFIIGITNALFLIFAPGNISGYWNLTNGLKINLVPLITSVDIVCGLLTGLCIYGIFGIPTFINIKTSVISMREKLTIIIIASAIMIFFRQLASRDLIQYGSFDLQVDLETISYCVIGSIGTIDILKLLRSNYIIPRIVIKEETLITTIKISLVMIVIYFLYHFVIEPSKWHNYEIPSHSFIYLKFDFPQPGRIILVSFMMFFNMLAAIGVRNLYFRYKLKSY